MIHADRCTVVLNLSTTNTYTYVSLIGLVKEKLVVMYRRDDTCG